MAYGLWFMIHYHQVSGFCSSLSRSVRADEATASSARTDRVKSLT